MNKALSIFNQLRPISIGFDNVFTHFERMFEDDLYITAGNYPPYNIVKTGPEKYNIEVALAGYSKEDINVDFAEGLLTIKSVKEEKSDEKDDMLHKGIAKRHFSRTFTIADDVEVKDAELKDGLLKVFLHRIVPEGKEARQIKIN
jgi:molecular chaperone IbpA